jgi:sulfur carrier protein ThiS
MNVVVNHKKLKAEIGLELFDLLAKTKLNNYEFATLADRAMDTLLDRFI